MSERECCTDSKSRMNSFILLLFFIHLTVSELRCYGKSVLGLQRVTPLRRLKKSVLTHSYFRVKWKRPSCFVNFKETRSKVITPTSTNTFPFVFFFFGSPICYIHMTGYSTLLNPSDTEKPWYEDLQRLRFSIFPALHSRSTRLQLITYKEAWIVTFLTDPINPTMNYPRYIH